MRHVTEEESLKILKPFMDREKFVRCTNHMPFPSKGFGPGVYRFTVNMMSLDLLIAIMEHDLVDNVFFTLVAPAPGNGVDGLSMNYKVYVKYHKVKSTRSRSPKKQ